MSHCKLVNCLFHAFPLNKWQDFLIRQHMQDCRSCQKKLASRNEVLKVMIQEERIRDLSNMATGFESKLTGKAKKEKMIRFPRWKWAYSIVAAAVIAAGIIAVSNISHWRNGQVKVLTRARFQINYLRIEGEPARAYLFKPQGTDMIIVWAQKNARGE